MARRRRLRFEAAPLVVTSRWHVGTHYAFDPTTANWQPLATVEETRGGIDAIAYEPAADAMVAMIGNLLGAPCWPRTRLT
jgi:hypothetical protein